MSRLPWREGRNYNIYVRGPHNSHWIDGCSAPGLCNNPYYKAAKEENDLKAAIKIVQRSLDALYIAKLKQRLKGLQVAYGMETEPLLIAPYKEGSPNRLATAAAVHLGKHLGLQVDSSIIEVAQGCLRELTPLQRLFNCPKFEGEVQRGRWYIIVDDHISRGTTMASLRSHIVRNGGRFACGCVLASPTGEERVNLNASAKDIQRVAAGFNTDIIKWFERMTDVIMDGLTQPEAAFLYSPPGKRQLAGFASQAGLIRG